MFSNIEHNPRSAFEYGIEYILQYDSPDLLMQGMDLALGPRKYRAWRGTTLVYQTNSVYLTKLPPARPISFPEDSPSVALPVKFDAGGATITTSDFPRGGWIVLNMLWRREVQCKINGSALPVKPDDWGRIRIQVPPGSSEIRMAFRPPWELGWLTGLLSLLCALGLGILSSRQSDATSTSFSAKRSC